MSTTESSPQQPHVLYVAWGYPPSRGAGMYRALATANAFARDGWKVTVLTATRDTFERLTGTDPDAEGHIDPRIDVVRIPFAPDRDETDLHKWSRARVFSPRLWDHIRWKMSGIEFPELGYGVWRRPLVEAAERIHREHPVDLTVGSANPNVDFAPGMHLHRTYGVPYVMDYRDAWHLDVYTGEFVGSRLARSYRIERYLLNEALEAWFVNEPIRRWHLREFPRNSSSFHVVANGFDPDFIGTAALGGPTTTPASGSSDGYTFGYLGTLYGPVALRETFEAWRLARSRSDVIARSRLVFRGRLGHYAEPDAAFAAVFDEFRSDGIVHLGPVSKTQVMDAYGAFDALVFLAAPSPYVTSGKVFEYAATGLPIGAFHHPDTAATSVLAGRPRVFAVAEPTPELIADSLIMMAHHLETSEPGDSLAARAWSAHLSRDAQLAPRITALRARLSSEAES